MSSHKSQVVREEARTKSEITYIVIFQATVAQWVELFPIFEVCAGEKVCEEGGHSRDARWNQEAE